MNKIAGRYCLEGRPWNSVQSPISKKVLRPIWKSFAMQLGYILQKRSLEGSGSDPASVARDLVDSQATVQTAGEERDVS